MFYEDKNGTAKFNLWILVSTEFFIQFVRGQLLFLMIIGYMT
jgi:hypothetical protein